LSIAGASGSAAAAVITALDTAIDAVNQQRANYGAVQNRFANVVSNLQTASENQTAARSRIMDADYAVETSNLSRANILQQAGNAMVAQANQLPQQVLSLLR
jgi:flagellin